MGEVLISKKRLIKLRYRAMVLASRVGSLHFYPARPGSGSVVYKICRELRLSMKHGIASDGPTMFWPATEDPSIELLPGVINGALHRHNKESRHAYGS